MRRSRAKKKVFKPEAEMTIYTAEINKKDLVSVFEPGCELIVDLVQVNEIDSAGLQILLLAKQECVRHESLFKVVHPSDAVLDVLELCSLTDLISAA